LVRRRLFAVERFRDVGGDGLAEGAFGSLLFGLALSVILALTFGVRISLLGDKSLSSRLNWSRIRTELQDAFAFGAHRCC
jgi:hypothetical protein